MVKIVDEQRDGVERERLQTIEAELQEVKRRLDRIWQLIETTDLDVADASERIREHRERKEKLEAAAEEARAAFSERKRTLDEVETIAAYAQDMSAFLVESELTERRAFIETFVKEIVVTPAGALMRYTVPMPDDSALHGEKAGELALNGPVLPTVQSGGRSRDRTCDLLCVRQAL